MMMAQPAACLRLHFHHHALGLFPGLRFGRDAHIDGIILSIGGNSGIIAAHQHPQSLFNGGLAQTGLGESTVEERLGMLVRSDNPTIATYAKNDAVDVRITAKAQTREEAERMV